VECIVNYFYQKKLKSTDLSARGFKEGGGGGVSLAMSVQISYWIFSICRPIGGQIEQSKYRPLTLPSPL